MQWPYTCPKCGCNLDPGEPCDCEAAPDAKAERKILTMADWNAAGDFTSFAKPGDPVEDEIVDEFIGCVPPTICRGNLVQSGEAYDIRYDAKSDRWKSTYITFARRAGRWYYCGCCFYGETVEVEKPVKCA